MRTFSFVAVVLAVLVRSTPADACQCIAPGTDEEETRRADVAFVGTVTSIVEKAGQPNVTAQVAVETALKGAQINTTLAIEMPAASALCGFHFERGKRYKVFAYKTATGTLTTRVCTASRQI
jgi:hypothetical protein